MSHKLEELLADRENIDREVSVAGVHDTHNRQAEGMQDSLLGVVGFEENISHTSTERADLLVRGFSHVASLMKLLHFI